MSTGLTPIFTEADIRSWTEAFQEKAEEKIMTLLKAAGEEFVKYARELHTYEDHTGNLRSSVGYIVIKDGEKVIEDFVESDKGTVKTIGLGKAKQLAENIALTYTEGFILIGVAGMQYAAAVEAKGYDVITGGCDEAEGWMRNTIKEVLNHD